MEKAHIEDAEGLECPVAEIALQDQLDAEREAADRAMAEADALAKADPVSWAEQVEDRLFRAEIADRAWAEETGIPLPSSDEF
jgi:hypothetical protein